MVTVTLREFAILGRYEKPLASSLACLLIAYGEIYEYQLSLKECSFDEWERRLRDTFDELGAGITDYGELQRSVVELASMEKMAMEKAAD
jgi:hypothetical protein